MIKILLDDTIMHDMNSVRTMLQKNYTKKELNLWKHMVLLIKLKTKHTYLCIHTSFPNELLSPQKAKYVCPWALFEKNNPHYQNSLGWMKDFT